MAAFRGSCLCGEVAFEVEGPFDFFLNCHCSRCRKASGTAHSCEVIVKAQALRWLRGEQSVVRFDLPQARSFGTAFCRTRPTDTFSGCHAPIGMSMVMDCFCRTDHEGIASASSDAAAESQDASAEMA